MRKRGCTAEMVFIHLAALVWVLFVFFFKLALAGFAFFALLFPTALKILNVYEFGPHSI